MFPFILEMGQERTYCLKLFFFPPTLQFVLVVKEEDNGRHVFCIAKNVKMKHLFRIWIHFLNET